MDTLDGTTWDILIAGTGLQQSLLALALSRSAKKVLHIDKNDYYGGSEAAFSLQEVEAWVEEVGEGKFAPEPLLVPLVQLADGMYKETLSQFSNASVSRSSPSNNAGNGPQLSFSRAYSLALAPQVMYLNSDFRRAIVSSKIYTQLDLAAVGSWWVYVPARQLMAVSGGTVVDTEDPTTSQGGGRLTKVPNGREDIFADQSLDPRSKRLIMKFLRFVADFESQTDLWQPYEARSFSEFLTDCFNLPNALQAPLLALTLSPDVPSITTTAFALPRIARHLRSIGMFGMGFGCIIPKWGGFAEVAQAACRAGAVGGTVYALAQGVREVQERSGTTDAGGEEATKSSIRLVGGDSITAEWVVGSNDDLPVGLSENASAAPKSTMSRSIFIVSSPLTMLFPSTAEGAPPSACAVVVFPTGSLSLAENSQAHTVIPPVHVFVHTSDTGECPSGQCVLYASTSLAGGKGFALLEQAVERLLQVVDESPLPVVLWSLRYEQSSGTSLAPNPPSSGPPDKIIRFPLMPLDLALDDSVLASVKSVWQKITRAGVDDFLEFEERDTGGDSD